MPYEIFDKKRVKVGSPAVSILASGRLSLNAEAGRLFQRNAVENVLLLSDPEQRKIALRPTGKKDKRGYIVAYESSDRASVCMRSFLLENGWDGKKYHHLDARWDEESGILECRLPEWENDDKPKLLASEGRKQKTG